MPIPSILKRNFILFASQYHSSECTLPADIQFYYVHFFSERMSTMGNAFVACGVVYCIDSYISRSTTINFAYDTKTFKQWNPNIQFTNQYGYNTMVDYNPRERVLYAWDNNRLVLSLLRNIKFYSHYVISRCWV